MIENMREYWFLYVILVVLIIVTAFVCKKAFTASAKRSKRMNEMMAKAKHEKELRDAYGELTAQIIENSPAAALFEGTALCLEAKCQKTEDTTGFYDSMTDGEKTVYALYYLLIDAAESNLSSFFKSSYRPLTSDAVSAVKEIFDSNIYAVVESMFNCYDENNESASVIPQEIDSLNNEFRELTEGKDLFALGGEYIKKNASEFLM